MGLLLPEQILFENFMFVEITKTSALGLYLKMMLAGNIIENDMKCICFLLFLYKH